jgi:type I restriction enzyme M protein
VLPHLLKGFHKPDLNLRPSRVDKLDVIGNTYELLIKNFAASSGKKAGECYIPPEVSDLIAVLVDPREGFYRSPETRMPGWQERKSLLEVVAVQRL